MFKNSKIFAVNADDREYHNPAAERGSKDFVISSSSLRLVFAKCPRAWIRGYEVPNSKSLDYGGIVDTLVLTPEKFNARYAVRPETYENTGMECPSCKSVTDAKSCKKCKVERVEIKITSAWSGNSDTCIAWAKAQSDAGKEIISENDLTKAKNAVARIFEDAEIKAMLDASDKQVWIKAEYHDEATGLIIPVQSLIDFVPKFVPLTQLCIGDLKTTKNAALIPWSRWARFIGYDIQAALGLDLYNAATSEDRRMYEWILSESEAPYEVGRRYDYIDELDGERDESSSLLSGRRMYKIMLANYCQFLKHNKWPSYDDSDESIGGKTRFVTDPYEEQRRMFAPKFEFGEEAEEENPDLIP